MNPIANIGYNKGFDMVPRLTDIEVDNDRWREFLDDIRELYADDPVLVSRPGVIEFKMGDHLSLPLEGYKFLRFSSKVSGRSTLLAELYIDQVYRVALEHFPGQLEPWHELSGTFGHYEWEEVFDSISSYNTELTGSVSHLQALHLLPALDVSKNQLSVEFVAHKLPYKITGVLSAEPLLAAGESYYLELRDRMSHVDAVSVQNLYSIRAIAGRLGHLGVFADQDIKRGTRIISERPLFTTSSDTNEAQIASILRTLHKDDQRKFLSLHNNFLGDKSPFSGILRTNGFQLGANSLRGGIFLKCSRINHACRPNAQHTWNNETGEETIHAVKNIPKGNEITIKYLSGPSQERRRRLKLYYGFECMCNLCSLPGPELALSDERLEEIELLDASIHDWKRLVSHPAETLAKARKLRYLLNAEAITDDRVGSVYYDAFQIVIAHGDQARAKVFATRAYKEHVICEGDDSPDAKLMKVLAATPTRHISFGFSNEWCQSIDNIPEDLNGQEFEQWLWTLRS